MYDMSKLKIRYFTMKLKNNKVIELEPPKMKVLKKIATLSKVSNDGELSDENITNLTEAVSLALSKNKQNYKVSSEKVDEEYDIFEILDFLTNYFEWVNNTQNQKN